MEKREHSLWVEKYRPSSLESYLSNEQMKEKMQNYIATGDIPHLLFTGPAGTGKTTIAKVLLSKIPSDVMILNASDENSIDTVRNKIRGFASTLGFNPLKIMLLDEFDGFTPQGQKGLRNLMEQYSDTTRFILTANYLERVIEPIVSRTQHFHVIPPSMKDVAILTANILQKENVQFEVTDLKKVLDAYYPDIRRVINQCQRFSTDGKLVINTQDLIASDYMLSLVDILKGTDKQANKITKVRQLIADAKVRDFIELYTYLFDTVDNYAPRHISQVILAIAEGQFRDSMVVDKEINITATLLNILNIID